MRTEVKEAIAHVLRGRIQNLEEREALYEDERALELRLILLKEGLSDLEQADPDLAREALIGLIEDADYTGGEI